MPAKQKYNEDLWDALSDEHQQERDAITNWAHDHDEEGPCPMNWDSPVKFPGLNINDWVALSKHAPQIVTLLGMDIVVGRWRRDDREPGAF